MTLSGLMT